MLLILALSVIAAFVALSIIAMLCELHAAIRISRQSAARRRADRIARHLYASARLAYAYRALARNALLRGDHVTAARLQSLQLYNPNHRDR